MITPHSRRPNCVPNSIFLQCSKHNKQKFADIKGRLSPNHPKWLESLENTHLCGAQATHFFNVTRLFRGVFTGLSFIKLPLG
jgi:hypothetical protein